jgi:PAS domain S-box-containing protein
VLAPIHADDGRLTHFVGVQNDVTARVEAEQTRDRFFALSLDLLCVASTAGYFQRVNPAFTATLGYSEDELLARPFIELVHPDDQVAALDALRTLRTSPLERFVNRYRHRDGTYRWLEWSAQPIAEQGLIYAVARDISARMAEEAARQAQQRQLLELQKRESLDVLVGGIAHDFNNLLTIIYGHIDLALAELPPDSSTRQEIEQARTAVRQTTRLAELLLTYAGRGTLRTQPVDLSAVVQEVLSLLHSTLPAGVSVRTQLGERLPSALLDANQMRQVVMNLILNASDALGAGPGEIRIATHTRVLTAADLREMIVGEGYKPGNYLCLEVADTGCGIDEATLARMFEPFFTTKRGGRGLGLANVLGIVRSLSGALRVQSAIGVGTTFYLYFAPSSVGQE